MRLSLLVVAIAVLMLQGVPVFSRMCPSFSSSKMH